MRRAPFFATGVTVRTGRSLPARGACVRRSQVRTAAVTTTKDGLVRDVFEVRARALPGGARRPHLPRPRFRPARAARLRRRPARRRVVSPRRGELAAPRLAAVNRLGRGRAGVCVRACRCAWTTGTFSPRTCRTWCMKRSTRSSPRTRTSACAADARASHGGRGRAAGGRRAGGRRGRAAATAASGRGWEGREVAGRQEVRRRGRACVLERGG